MRYLIRPSKSKVPELRFQFHLTQMLMLQPWCSFAFNYKVPQTKKSNQSSIVTPSGLPDIHFRVRKGFLEDRAVPGYFEAKGDGTIRTDAQIEFIENALRDGCIAFFVKDFYDVQKQLKIVGLNFTIYPIGTAHA